MNDKRGFKKRGGERGQEWRRKRREWAGGDRTKVGMANRGGGREKGGAGENWRTLVGYVSLYWTSYEREGAD